MSRFLGVVLFPLLLTAQAGAANLFVDVSGSGTACTQASPCPLATALAQMGSGDTVYVAGGTYTGSGEQVVLLDRSLTYTLQGGWDGAGGGTVVVDPDANETVLDGQNARRVITITSSYPTIRGFTITRGNATGLTALCQTMWQDQSGCGGGIFAINSLPVIEDNVIENNVASSVTPAGKRGVGGGIMIDYNWPVIRDNVIRDNTASLDGEGYGGGIALHICSTSTTIQSNEISGNRASAAGYGQGGGIHTAYGTMFIADNLIEANTSSTVPGSALGAGIYTYLGAPSVDRNVFVGNRGDSAVEISAFEAGRFWDNRVVANRTDVALSLAGDTTGFRFYVRNNFISDGASTNVRLAGSDAKGLDVTLIHNTIVGDERNDGIEAHGNVDAVVVNNIVAWHETGIAGTATDTLAVDGTLFWQNGDDGVRGANAVDGNPNFVDRLMRNYHLRIGSSAVDRAVSTAIVIDYDIDGQQRPWAEVKSDIGADEQPPTRFDFGTADSPVAPGYTRATEASRFQWYTGWGWASGFEASRNRSAGAALTRDFNMTRAGIFSVEVPYGVYDVTATFGDASFAHDQMQVSLEGEVVDMISTAKGEFTTRTWRVTTDLNDALDLVLEDKGGADVNVVSNALEVRDPTIVKVDFGTGGSPVAPSYSRASHLTTYSDALRFGWVSGTVSSRDRGGADPLLRDFCLSGNATFRLGFLPQESYLVLMTTGDAQYAHDAMELRAGGAYVTSVATAVGEFRTQPFRIGQGLTPGGDVDVVIKDNGGTDPNAVINSVEIGPLENVRFDFGTPTSPVEPRYRRATNQRYRTRDGFGWLAGTLVARDRANADNLVRDLVATAKGTFVVDLPRGTYSVGVTLGDTSFAHDQMKVSFEGTEVGIYSTKAGEFAYPSLYVEVTDGQLTVDLEDLGGTDQNIAVVSLFVQ